MSVVSHDDRNILISKCVICARVKNHLAIVPTNGDDEQFVCTMRFGFGNRFPNQPLMLFDKQFV